METALADALQKHTPRSITGIVMRPRTGEILAMASLPNYDPNKPGTVTPDARRNRVITRRDGAGLDVQDRRGFRRAERRQSCI